MKKVYVVLSSHGSFDDHYKKVECVCANYIFAESKKIEIENKYRERIPFPFTWCTEEEALDLGFAKDEDLAVYNDWWFADNRRREFNSCYIEEIEYYEQ